MNFKIRSAILFTTLVALLLLVSYLAIYISYAGFKQDEFYLRLEQKALTTYKLLTQVKEIDYDLLKAIDRNTINALYNEKVLIFNEQHELIYSSIDDRAVSYSTELLARIEAEKMVRYRDAPGSSVIGIKVNDKGTSGIVIASADDKFGDKKLQNLVYTLVFSFISALVITAFLSYFYVKQSFAPLDVLNRQISRITQNRLNERVPLHNSQDELSQLANNFNNMLERIESAFYVQRSFIQHASHELRTPLANLIASCESALNKELTNEEYKELIRSLNEEHRNLVELTNALLLLSKYENLSEQPVLQENRADELLFTVMDEVQLQFPGHMIRFNFSEAPVNENDLVIIGNEMLLRTLLGNLLRNACKYASDGHVTITVNTSPESVRFEFRNAGPVLDADELPLLMQPFFRGRNSGNQKGYGLGLSIANRIAGLHKGRLLYEGEHNINTFTLELPHLIL
jgi:two-component system sensor histidine kinase ArlS